MRRSTAGALVLVLAASVALTSPAAADVEITEKARTHFRAGVNLLNDPDGARYEEAYEQFRAAYDDSPSWKILGNLGICAMKMERDGEAIEAFEKYLAGGGADLDPDERAQMERDLQTLKAGVVWVTIQSDPPGASIVDKRTPARGTPVTNRYEAKGPLKIGVRTGAHRMTASLKGYEDAVWEFDASAGASMERTFKLEKPKPAPAAAPPGPGGAAPGPVSPEPVMERPVPTAVFIGLAATGVLAVGAGVTGVMATGKKSEFDDANDGSDPAAAKDLQDSGKSLNLVTDILLGGAVVAGAVTAVLYLNRPEVPAQRDALQVSPTVGRSGGGVFLTGRF